MNGEIEALRKATRKLEVQYNPELAMLRVPYKTNGYHTALTGVEQVHATRASIEYALALLDTEEAEYEERAFAVIERVIGLQDQDPAHDTYGIWSYYYEEPLERMAPPDWNWADFIGKVLVMIAIRHEGRLPVRLRESLKQAAFHACESIIRRNMGPHYTNIAIMGSFVTIMAGEHFGHNRYLEYGLQRFENFHAYTRRLNTFQEYNSPTYTVIAIIELSKLHTYSRSSCVGTICAEMLRLAWRMAGDHYHVSTGQWSGPHSRCYRTLLTDVTRAFLQRGLGMEWERLALTSPLDLMEWHRSGAACPADLRKLFFEPRTRETKEIYCRYPDGFEKTATTYMTPAFSLGSADKEVMWNQRRNLLAYIDNGGKPAYAALRVLHDGYDFSAPVLTTAQDKGHALCGLQFSVNGGDTHIGLDRIDGAIQANDLRLRLEIGGELQEAAVAMEDRDAAVRLGETQLSLSLLFLAFEGNDPELAAEPRWTVVREDEKLNIDLVLYSGERRVIDIAGLRRAAVVFALSVEPASAASAHDSGRMLAEADAAEIRAEWTPANSVLAFRLPLRPDRVEALRGQA